VSAASVPLKLLWSQRDTLTLQDQILCRKFFRPEGASLNQIVVPRHGREEIVKKCHEEGHFGVTRTQEAIARRYFWPGWKKDVAAHVTACLQCNKRKGPPQKIRLPLKRYQCNEVFQRVAIDMLGPILPTTERGNKYLLVLTDYYTKWAEALPVTSQNAEIVADVLLEQVFSRFGAPAELHSDQGKNFDSVLVKRVCERLGIYKTRTTRYRPQSDGQTERLNRTLLASLAKMCDQEKDWDTVVPLVMFYYRATRHAATGFTPNMLMFGRDVRMPLDVIFPPTSEDVRPHHVYLKDLEDRLTLASELARKHLLTSWEQMNIHHPTSRCVPELKLSEPVLVFDPAVPRGYSPKLASMWKGPHRVKERLSQHLYRVEIGKHVKVIHRSHLFQPPMPAAHP